MRFQHLDLNLLVALDVLLAEQNITRAAARLHMTQSAASGVLNRLRNYFDDELLSQVGRKMVPTALAKELQEPTREVLLKINTTIARRPADDPLTSKRHFRIMASDYMINVLLCDVLRVVNKEAPGMTFEFFSPDQHSVDLLLRGELDLMLAPEKFMLPDHEMQLLFEEQYVCLVCENNEFVGDTLTLENYLELGHTTVSFGRERTSGLEEWLLNEYGIQRRLEVVAHSYHSLPQMLIGTNRIATIHRRLAAQFAKRMPLRMLSSPVDLPVMREFMCWNRTHNNDQPAAWLRDKILSAAT
ncbi:DNA-binding transcriptional LysR family regulator [Buttiauxella sp. BIGb0552]|uniref:LysR family transcriptional regulator n=1 Tax=Buttiauxella sp. BIGb0552 TaxID=2485120 RepID=UPI0010666771|nr:LysR family transcriptional regulator [Buttiauxella sp. BIGb0552]TDX18540.1 DNA-binding transcriptional LysR family regulator [Buttiauxella sp. BIGb0552]